jgi:hypothetical protein
VNGCPLVLRLWAYLYFDAEFHQISVAKMASIIEQLGRADAKSRKRSAP